MALAQLDDKATSQVEVMMRELQRSADRRRKGDNDGAAVGAVVIQNGCQYYGFNAVGKNGMSECHTHAEIMAIKNACSDPMNDIDSSLMITTRFPCEYCAANIVRHGVTELYAPPIREGSKWRSSQESAKRFMEHAGIKITIIETAGVRG